VSKPLSKNASLRCSLAAPSRRRLMSCRDRYQDSFTLCIGHLDYGRQAVIIDCLREVKPPFAPEAVCEQFAKVLQSYNIHKVIGDRYAGLWPVEQFAKFHITYEQSAAPKSDLYRDLLALINSARIELLDHPKMIAQLTALERRVARGGKDSIDHPPGGHDDIANAVAGLAAINIKNTIASFDFVDTDRDVKADPRTDAQRNAADYRLQRFRQHLAMNGIPPW
jgi:hypothetical protein